MTGPAAGALRVDLADVLAGTDALTHLDAAWDAAWKATDPDLLELCRARVARLLGARIDGPAPVPASEIDRAALAFTEQYVIDVASVPDDLVRPLREHLGDTGLSDFVHALLVVEQRLTLELALGPALGRTSGAPA